jgi:8-oxo-dGTP diphosphatase
MGETLSNTIPIIKAASAVILRDQKVLLVRRASALGKGLWSLPGGKAEMNETAEQTAIREVAEETGLVFSPQFVVGQFTIKTAAAIYAIDCFSGNTNAAEASPASDVDGVDWVDISQLNSFTLAPNTEAAIRKAWHSMHL